MKTRKEGQTDCEFTQKDNSEWFCNSHKVLMIQKSEPVFCSVPKKAGHTPKQWYARNAGNDFQGMVIDEATGKDIAVSYDKADACLLASAPDLLTMLRQCQETLSIIADAIMDEQYIRALDYSKDRLLAIEKAISKAEGNHGE